MPLKTVAFVGDAQARVVADLYRDLIGARRGELVLHYGWSGPVPPEFSRSLDVFDLVCVQDRGSANAPLRESGLAADKVRHFPLLWSGVTWPFHDWRSPEGGASCSTIRLHRDRFLDGLIADEATADEVVKAYLALDIPHAAGLPSPLEGLLEHYRAVERATGVALAALIEESFTDEQLFEAPTTPNPRLLAAMAAALLEQLGATPVEVALARDSRARLPRQGWELPIHPWVAGQLGLRYVDGQTRYRLGPGLSCTFAEYVALYVQDTEAGAFPAAGQSASAPPFAARVLDLPAAPTGPDPATPGRLAEVEALLHRGEAANAARQAALLCRDQPDLAEAHELLAEARWRSGDSHGAAQAARTAIALSPQQDSAWRLLGQASAAFGDAASAEAALRLDPLSPDARNHLAELLEDRAGGARAIEVLQQGLALGVWNAQTFSLLGSFHLRSGDLAKAEEAFMLGLDIEPRRRDLQSSLADVRETQRNRAAA